MSAEKLNRREFLKGAAMTAVGILAASCAQPTPQVIEKPVTVVVEKAVPVEKQVVQTVVVEKPVAVEKEVVRTVVVEKEVPVEKVVKETVVQEKVVERIVTPTPSKYHEAPMLAELVKAGKLPPVEERVPQEPLVLEPYEMIGKYGGIWRQMHMGAVDRWQNSYKMMEYVGKYTPKGEIVPNVAKAWSFSSDATAITIYLRKGMKWSDGAPFTTADVIYWWEDVVLNDELMPSKPSQFKLGGELATVTKSDDYTFTLAFPKKYGAFEVYMPAITPWQPAHYLKKFHVKYATKADLDAAMKQVGVEKWTDLYGTKTAFANNPGTPDLMAWIPTALVDAPVQIWERNAYYWKVDTAGNQLPYIDAVHRILLPDKEAILLKAIAGEADFESRRIESVENYPVVMENREKGNYRVVLEDNAGSNFGTIFFNFHHKDPVLKQLFNTLDFRVALSHAIDRQEISDTIYKGLAPISAATVAIGSPWYEDEFRYAYTDYDPDKANQMLDALGLDKRDSEGFRLLPDGRRLSLVILVFTPFPPSSVEIQELVKAQWAKVGVEMIVKPTDRLLWVQQVHALEHDIASYIMNMGHLTQTPLELNQIAPISEGSQHWAPQWGLWYESGGKQGEEPPEEVKQLQKLREQALEESNAEKRNQIIKDMLRIHAKNCYFLGIVNESDYGRWMVVNKNLGNVPDRIPGTNAVAMYTCLLFFKK